MLAVENNTNMANLQNDLNQIYSWVEANNLQFNNLKFELLQYGDNKDLNKESYQYMSSSQLPIKSSEIVQDLGVGMSVNCSFKAHINSVVEDAKSRAGWVLRTFKDRRPLAMLTLWKSMVLPKLEYCSQLWCPTKKGDILTEA